MSDSLPDGVHIGLPEVPYFEQEALGSTDLTRLFQRKHGWWWSSRYNPDRRVAPTLAQNFGQALHAAMLEGIEAYEDRFAVQPEKPANALMTGEACKRFLEGEGVDVKTGRSGFKAQDWIDLVVRGYPDIPVWPDIEANFAEYLRLRDLRREGLKQPPLRILTAVEDRMLRTMFDAAMADPEVATLLGSTPGFPPLAEVSVFKTLPGGIRRRWRLDRLFPRFIMDLKSMRGKAVGRPLRFQVGDHIAMFGYDIQRADHNDGRGALYEFIRDGFQVFGGTTDQRHFLQQFPERFSTWDYVWMFYQKPDPSGVAPVIIPVWDDMGSPLQRYGERKIQIALAFYRDMVARFGLDRPWTHVESVHYTDDTMSPSIALPHWIAEEDPIEEGAYADDL